MPPHPYPHSRPTPLVLRRRLTGHPQRELALGYDAYISQRTDRPLAQLDPLPDGRWRLVTDAAVAGITDVLYYPTLRAARDELVLHCLVGVGAFPWPEDPQAVLDLTADWNDGGGAGA